MNWEIGRKFSITNGTICQLSLHALLLGRRDLLGDILHLSSWGCFAIWMQFFYSVLRVECTKNLRLFVNTVKPRVHTLQSCLSSIFSESVRTHNMSSVDIGGALFYLHVSLTFVGKKYKFNCVFMKFLLNFYLMKRTGILHEDILLKKLF